MLYDLKSCAACVSRSCKVGPKMRLGVTRHVYLVVSGEVMKRPDSLDERALLVSWWNEDLLSKESTFRWVKICTVAMVRLMLRPILSGTNNSLGRTLRRIFTTRLIAATWPVMPW